MNYFEVLKHLDDLATTTTEESVRVKAIHLAALTDLAMGINNFGIDFEWMRKRDMRPWIDIFHETLLGLEN